MTIDLCPCGSGNPFTTCCCPIISGADKAQTAEQLMRSRYSAFVKKDVGYLVSTTLPKSRRPDLAQSIAAWMQQVEWVQLHVLKTDKHTVEFMAEYVSEGKPCQHHEHSSFKKYKGKWFYVGEE